MSWTHFYDMCSGGSQKLDWEHIYIEAQEDEAKIIFYNRFKRNPERITCTCCGEDYSISTGDTIKQLTGYRRNCRSLETPRDPKTGLYKNNDPVLVANYYLDPGEEPPEGYSVDEDRKIFGEWISLEDYLNDKSVLAIPASEIKDEERVGEVPDEGFVWV